MERKVYEQMAELDSRHWWFTARHRILDGIIERIVKPPKDARILELGAGTGHNLAMSRPASLIPAREISPASGSAVPSSRPRCPTCRCSRRPLMT
jgi:hypothetical protein